MTTEAANVIDTGVLAEVPEDDRRDTDDGVGANASFGGLDDDLDDVYDHPGEIVTEDLA